MCLIKASAESQFKEYKKSMGGPPQNIFAAAAATPDGYIVEIVDETIGKKINFNTNADAIFIFFSTPDAMRGYKIADIFLEKKKTVILGGLHVSNLPEEASKFADAIMIGEIENYFETLLNDLENDCLQKIYKSETPVDLADLNPYPTQTLGPKDYGDVWSVIVGRGCDNACSYCVVNPFFKKLRFRPIENIINEIMNCGAKIIELHADNIIANRDYAIELFTALIPLNIRWIGECTITVAEDEELLDLMVASGLSDLLVGIETPDQKTLDAVGKSFIKVDKIKSYVDKIQSLDIDVDASFLFGFDTHERDIFDKTLAFALDVGIKSCHGVILTPFPGTPFYRQIELENRILTKEYSKYDCTHAVFKPKHMTAGELEKGVLWFDTQFNRLRHGKKQNELSPTSQKMSMPSIKKERVKTTGDKKIMAIIGLIMVITALVFDKPIFFGILYLTWAIQDLKSGYAFILEDVSKDENPILYWITCMIWLGSGLYVLSEPLIIKLMYYFYYN